MSFTKRYQQQLRRAYSIMREEGPNLDIETLLQGAVKSINDITCPDVIVPALLVHGALPMYNNAGTSTSGLPVDKPAHTMYKRAKVVHKAGCLPYVGVS